MKSLRFTIWLALLLLVPHVNTRAQSAEPITAKQRSLSYKIQPDGSRVLTQEQVGAFYRSSSGVVMNTVGNFSTFIDEQGHAYEVNHLNKKAIFVERQEPPHLRKLQGFTGSETVNGLNCAVRTILVNGKPGGKEYWHQPYGLMIRTEWALGDSQTVREVYDVKVSEPDQSLLRIPDGYSIDPKPEQ